MVHTSLGLILGCFRRHAVTSAAADDDDDESLMMMRMMMMLTMMMMRLLVMVKMLMIFLRHVLVSETAQGEIISPMTRIGLIGQLSRPIEVRRFDRVTPKCEVRISSPPKGCGPKNHHKMQTGN